MPETLGGEFAEWYADHGVDEGGRIHDSICLRAAWDAGAAFRQGEVDREHRDAEDLRYALRELIGAIEIAQQSFESNHVRGTSIPISFRNAMGPFLKKAQKALESYE